MSLLEAMLLDPHRHPKDIWIALRTDGNKGSGTADDPYNGGTWQRFDALMRSFDTQGLENITIHLGPGVYETQGTGGSATGVGWRMKKGWRMVGSGIDVTTLKLVGVTDNTRLIQAIGAKAYNDRADYAEVSDLTIDCNLPGNPGMIVGGVGLIGSHTRIRRVRAIRFGTESPEHAGGVRVECFVLGVAGAHPDLGEEIQDCLIEDCLCEHPSENNSYVTTVLLVGSGENAYGIMAHPRGCVLRNNHVNCTYSNNEVPIERITRAGTTATVTTMGPHGRVTGEWVAIAGAQVNGQVDDTYFNGTFEITKINDAQFSYSLSGAPPSEPTGEMFVDRYPSHKVALISLEKKAGDPTKAKLTSATPHYRKPGSKVTVESTDIPEGSGAFYGHFTVTQVLNNRELEYQMLQEPTADSTGFRFCGVAFQALTNGGLGSIIEGNQVEHARIGVYHDTWNMKGVVVRNNQFRDVNAGYFENMGRTSPLKEGDSLVSEKLSGVHVATFTTKNDHGLAVGQAVRIDAGSGNESYSGFFVIRDVPTSKSFTYLYDPDLDTISLDEGAQFGALWQVGNFVIENNLIELHRRISVYGPPTGITTNAVDVAPVFIFREVVIRGNNIIHVDEPPSSGTKAIRLISCEKALIEDNTTNLLDYPSDSPMDFIRSNRLSFFNNRTVTGELVAGFDQDTGKRTEDLETRIDDALFLAL